MKTWWLNKTPREQQLLKGMLAALLMAIYWYGAVVPLNNAIERQTKENRTLARHLRALNKSAEDKGLTAVIKLKAPVAQIIEDSAQQAGLQVQVIEAAERRWTVTGSAAPLPLLFAWLDELKQKSGIYPAELKLIAQENERVKIDNLVLNQAGAND